MTQGKWSFPRSWVEDAFARAGHADLTSIDVMPFASSAESELFPGAILPKKIADGNWQYYAVTKTPVEWRRLQPLLLSHVGFTVTEFNGLPSEDLDKNDPLEKYLLDGEYYALASLKPKINVQRLTYVLLSKLCSNVINADLPDKNRPVPTSELLYQWRLSLVAKDRGRAEGILKRLKQESRIDALNLYFLKVELLKSFQDWQSLRNADFFAPLTQTRRPPKVSAALINSFYVCDLKPFVEKDDPAGCMGAFKETVLPASGDLFDVLPPSSNAEILNAFIVASCAEQAPTDETVKRVQDYIKNNPDSAPAKFWEWFSSGTDCKFASIEEDTFDINERFKSLTQSANLSISDVKRALHFALQIDSLDAYKEVGNIVQNLPEDAIAELKSGPLRFLLNDFYAVAGEHKTPNNLRDWFELLPDNEFTNALEILEVGVKDWPLYEWVCDPSKVSEFVALLNGTSDGVAQDRLQKCLPILVEWVTGCPEYPNKYAFPIYKELLALFAIYPNRGDLELGASMNLFEGLLQIGLEKNDYKEVLDWAWDLVLGANGVYCLDWILDLNEATSNYSAPDPEHRHSFWIKVITHCIQFGTSMKLRHKLSLANFLDRLSLKEYFEEFLSTSEDEVKDGGSDNSFEWLKGKMVAIYTLTESAAKQAQNVLEKILPGIDVRLNHEYSGSTQLKALATNADVFVVVTQSAKHAATEFIQANRPSGKEVLYTNGKGMSSILKALEVEV